MSSELRLSIGGICFSLVSDEGISVPKEGAPYLPFFSRSRPDVVLRFHPDFDRSLSHKTRETLFHTRGHWKLSRLSGPQPKLVLEVDGRKALMSPDLASIQLHAATGYKGFPFGFPLDELLMINLMSRGRGLLVHACGMKDHEDRGLLFLGNSGAGKSTTARLWKNEPEVLLLSDDRLVLRRAGSGFWMYGTPWHGDARVYSPDRVALSKIFFLKHARKNAVTKLSPAQAAAAVLKRSFPTFWDKKGMAFSLRFCSELVRRIPCYEFGFLPDKTAVDFIKTLP